MYWYILQTKWDYKKKVFGNDSNSAYYINVVYETISLNKIQGYGYVCWLCVTFGKVLELPVHAKAC
jgi:hypothetical protein